MIEAANAEEEALAIAVALREALETPGKTAALVTPDRALARRVVAALERWQVAVDDSGGDALADTPRRRVRAARRRSRARRPRAGDAAGAAQASAAAARRGGRHARRRRSPRSNARCCAARARAPAATGSAMRSPTFRANRDAMHRSDPRWLIADDEFDVAAELIAQPRRGAGAAGDA